MMLTEKECKQIMQLIVKCILTEDGIRSTLHTAVRYAPRFLGDIGLLEPIVIQGAGQIPF